MLAFESFGACQVPLVVKNPAAHTGDTKGGFDPRVGKIPWRRKWQPHRSVSRLENPMDRGAWWGHTELDTVEGRSPGVHFNLETEPSEQADTVVHLGAR